MSEKGIKLHKEYGLNPTIAQCVLCGKEKNEIALLGAEYKEQAPNMMVVSNEPCDECIDMISKGVLIISVKDGSDKDNPFRSGRKFCVKVSAAKKMFGDKLKESRVIFAEDTVLDRMGFPRKDS